MYSTFPIGGTNSDIICAIYMYAPEVCTLNIVVWSGDLK